MDTCAPRASGYISLFSISTEGSQIPLQSCFSSRYLLSGLFVTLCAVNRLARLSCVLELLLFQRHLLLSTTESSASAAELRLDLVLLGLTHGSISNEPIETTGKYASHAEEANEG